MEEFFRERVTTFDEMILLALLRRHSLILRTSATTRYLVLVCVTATDDDPEPLLVAVYRTDINHLDKVADRAMRATLYKATCYLVQFNDQVLTLAPFWEEFAVAMDTKGKDLPGIVARIALKLALRAFLRVCSL